MILKDTWVDGGPLYFAADQNDVAAQINTNVTVIASAHNSATNLLIDGSYNRDAAWWAGALGAGIELSTTRAFSGTQSLKLTGPRSHRPNVTAAGEAGDDATYGVIESEGGRIYRFSCRIWREAGNTTAGHIRAAIGQVGGSGTDIVGGFGPEDTVNQVDIPTGQWFEYVNWFTVATSGANSPYVGVYPLFSIFSADGADVFYLDHARFEDMTNAPPELVAPPPTGDRTTDTYNVQRLVDFAQDVRGTVVLREGTYAVDIVTARTYRQPRIVGQGKQLTFIDGTIKMQGTHDTADGNFSGGWLEGFSWTGSHPGEAALELSGVTGVHGKELFVRGTYTDGILFHNELTDDYVETCSFVMDFYYTVDHALHYKVTAGQASFHGSGLELGSNVQCSLTNAAILIDTDARPYNAPMSAHIWTNTDAHPIFQHNGEVQSNFSGNLTVEALGSGVAPDGTGMWIANGNPVYLGGSLNTYLGSGTLNYGTFRVMSNVAAQGGTLTPWVSVGPTAAAEHLALSVGPGQAAPLDLQTNGSNRWSIQKTSTAESGTYTGSDLQILGYNNTGGGSYVAMSINRDNGAGDFHYGLTCASPGTTTGSVVTVDGTQTLTNKRTTYRIGTVTSSATPTINTNTVDQFNITALATAITSFTTNLSGTPTDGQLLDVRIKGDATPRAITWGASFTGTLLSTTAANKTHLQRLKYDAAVSKWAGYSADSSGY